MSVIGVASLHCLCACCCVGCFGTIVEEYWFRISELNC